VITAPEDEGGIIAVLLYISHAPDGRVLAQRMGDGQRMLDPRIGLSRDRWLPCWCRGDHIYFQKTYFQLLPPSPLDVPFTTLHTNTAINVSDILLFGPLLTREGLLFPRIARIVRSIMCDVYRDYEGDPDETTDTPTNTGFTMHVIGIPNPTPSDDDTLSDVSPLARDPTAPSAPSHDEPSLAIPDRLHRERPTHHPP
jgi:hypothetical protein